MTHNAKHHCHGLNQVLSCRLSHLASLAKGWAVKLYRVCVFIMVWYLDLEVVSSKPTTSTGSQCQLIIIVCRLTLSGACDHLRQQENLHFVFSVCVCVEEHAIVHLINNTRE